ncbi:MAG TPA: glutamate-5-semialdehyde dehydrogenase [Terriglobales bacterium]|nr:glutamate-5-semialdehyde dehydrogenase [Terriglobales bacterium]
MSAEVRQIAERSKKASRAIASLGTEQKDRALAAMAEALAQNSAALLKANDHDMAQASKMVASGEITASTFERLKLSPKKLEEMVEQIRSVAALTDPVGRVLERTQLDDGLILEKTAVPIGVLAVIFEARPDAVTQIGALAVKSGNAVIMKPGKEVEQTAAALVHVLRCGLKQCGIEEDAIQSVPGREAIQQLLAMSDLVDLVIPRGSRQLVDHIQATTRIPVLGHAEGICHVYVDTAADLEMALSIIDDAKTDYPAVCNAAETALVHESIAQDFLPKLAERLRAKKVKLLGCGKTMAILGDIQAVKDWHTEYSDLILAIRVVRNIEEAIDHIHCYGSSHTETIVTNDNKAAARFLRDVDSAGVFHNASTRFADGYRYGFGAEVGISTSKLHARGPVGLEGLTTYKYVLRGEGQVAGDYRKGRSSFKHKKLAIE